MFTGIIEAAGEIVSADGPRIRVRTDLSLSPGDSIAVDGVCLTAVASQEGGFSADLSEETLSRTSLGALRAGSQVNLERPLAAAGRLGGHVVQGHVDCCGRIDGVTQHESSRTVRVWCPREVHCYLAPKGSVAVDGVSLTISEVNPDGFSVDLIPFTLDSTTLGGKKTGDVVNLEADILAKYVESLLEKRFRVL
ncbi:MAG: riboflavin synthase [Actinomycetota bacterium]